MEGEKWKMEARGGLGREGWTGEGGGAGRKGGREGRGGAENGRGGEGRRGRGGDGVTRLTNGQCWQFSNNFNIELSN